MRAVKMIDGWCLAGYIGSAGQVGVFVGWHEFELNRTVLMHFILSYDLPCLMYAVVPFLYLVQVLKGWDKGGGKAIYSVTAPIITRFIA